MSLSFQKCTYRDEVSNESCSSSGCGLLQDEMHRKHARMVEECYRFSDIWQFSALELVSLTEIN